MISLPHVRGGVSLYARKWALRSQSSPRAWGCFSLIEFCTSRAQVFPTCVGVFLFRGGMVICSICLPHVRGGVSQSCLSGNTGGGSSPRAWGCFCRSYGQRGRRSVFPTCVGVFPEPYPEKVISGGLPHVRGGVSADLGVLREYYSSSPRAWGCFCRD